MKIFKISNKKIIVFIILFSILIFSYKYFSLIQGFNILDEGIFLSGTERIMGGETIYKDIFLEYAPGRFYLLSLFFNLFGISILASRIMSFFILIIITIVLYLLSKSIIKNKLFAIFPSLLVISFSQNVQLERFLFPLITFLVLFYIHKIRKLYLIFIPGILAGISFLFSQDTGIYTLIACLIFILITNIRLKYSTDINLRFIYLKKVLKQSISFLISALICVLLFLYYSYKNNSLNDMIYALFIYPLRDYILALPYPSFFYGFPNLFIWFFRGGFIFYLPFLIYILTVCLLIKDLYKKNNNKIFYYTTTILIFGLCLIKNVSLRSDFSHLKYILIPVYILGMFLLYRAYNYIKQYYPKLAYLVFILPLLFVIQWPIYDMVYQPYSNNTFLDIPRGQIYLNEENAEEIRGVVDYIKENTNENEFIFVVPYEAGFYFLTDRNNPTKFDYLLPGVLNEEKEKEIISIINTIKVRYIIYGHGWDVDGLKFEEYNKILNSYILKNYFIEKKIRKYDILKRLPH